MSEAETIRLIGEILGVVGILAAGFWRLAVHVRNWAKKILTAVDDTAVKLNGVNARLDKVNGSIKRLTDSELEIREDMAWLAGKIGEEAPRRRDRT